MNIKKYNTTPIKRLLTIVVLSFALFSCKDQPIPVVIPSEEHVGAQAMPEEIASITGAPFEMPQLKRPVFPNLIVDIKDKGANEGDPITDVVNKAIDDVSAQGGGVVVIPAGKWKSARITLKSNVNLCIAEGAEVEFSGLVADWLPAVFTRHEGIELLGAGAFIYANGEDNIAVTGNGTIIGPEMDSEVRRRINTAADVEKDIPVSTPLADRLFDGMEGREFQPPRSIAPINCTNVLIEGITMNRSAIWNVVPIYCENVIIRGITVNSIGIPRGDGIDIESSKNVLIEFCTLNCGDDCFTLKSGRGKDGLRVGKPTENVVIRYSLAKEGHGAITCGSETAGNIKNVYAHDCVFKGTWNGIRFKAYRPRGGGSENVMYERIRMIEVKNAFVWDMLGSRRWIGELADRLPIREINELTPVVRDIHVRDFIVESSNNFINANCIPEVPLRNVVIENGVVRCKKLIPVLNDVDGFTLRHLTINSEDDKINILDGRNILFEDVRFGFSKKEITVSVMGEHSSGIELRNEGRKFDAGGSKNRFILQDRIVNDVETSFN